MSSVDETRKGKIVCFAAAPDYKRAFEEAVAALGSADSLPVEVLDLPFTAASARLAAGAAAVVVHAGEKIDENALRVLAGSGKAGPAPHVLLYHKTPPNLDRAAAARLGVQVTHVPSVCPDSVAEHAVALALCANRRIDRAWRRTRDGNFLLGAGLVGVDFVGKTVGVVGLGRVGRRVANIFAEGFGCKIICYDPKFCVGGDLPPAGVVAKQTVDEVFSEADVVSLHCPLIRSETEHLVDAAAVAKMKPGVILINVARGGLVDLGAVIEGLKSAQIGLLGIDVYDEAHDDWSCALALVRAFPNVVISERSSTRTRDAMAGLAARVLRAAANVNDPAAAAAQKEEEQPAPSDCSTGSAPVAARSAEQQARDLTLGAQVREAMPDGAGGGGKVSVCPSAKEDGPRASPPAPQPQRIAIFSTTEYVRGELAALQAVYPESFFIEARCSAETAHLAGGADAVCLFVNDACDASVIDVWKAQCPNVRLVLLRCAGFDRVDLAAAKAAGLKVARVPKYSPHAVAEHAVALACALNRKLHLTCGEADTLPPAAELRGKTCGIVGTGKIGQLAAKIFGRGFGMRVLCYDVFPNVDVMVRELGCTYVDSLDDIYAQADVISLHVPLLPATRHLLAKGAFEKMKKGVVLVNCSRGGLVHTGDLIEALANGTVAAAGLDVYEHEDAYFFRDFTNLRDQDRLVRPDLACAAAGGGSSYYEFATLRSFPNVIVTPHSAFLTEEALRAICDTTILNARHFFAGEPLAPNEVA